jgi:hypothetical protein
MGLESRRERRMWYTRAQGSLILLSEFLDAIETVADW